MALRSSLRSVLTIATLFTAASFVASQAVAQGDFDGDGVPHPNDNCDGDPNPSQADADSDGVGDACDNCSVKPNSAPDSGGNIQLDYDADGYGNLCDPDFNGDGIVGASDYILLLSEYQRSFTDPLYDPRVDLDGDGAIGASDYGILLGFYGNAPGPSGLPCAGSEPCFDATPDLGHQPIYSLLAFTPDPANPTPDPSCPAREPFYPVGGSVVFRSTTPINFATLRVFLNKDELPPSNIVQLSETSLRVTGLVEGANELELTGDATNGLPIEATHLLWAGAFTQTVSVRDESGGAISGASVLIRFVKEPTLTARCLTDTSGVARFVLLPSGGRLLPTGGSFAVEATTPAGQLLTGTFGTAGNFEGSMVLRLLLPLPPSPIDNNDFSQGLAGWEINNPEANELFPHQE